MDAAQPVDAVDSDAGGRAPTDASIAPTWDGSWPDGGTLGTLCSACPAGTKSCGGSCYPTSDPYFSCGTEANSDVPGQFNATIGCDSQGLFVLQSCDPGRADCDSSAANGCETDITTPQNCGACGHACNTGQVCANGGCTSSCPFPQTSCNGTCADLSANASHCGTCGTACGTVYFTEVGTCTNGNCGLGCRAGFVKANLPSGTTCVDPMKDARACGSGLLNCAQQTGNGIAWSPTAVCAAGACELQCPLGWTMCGDQCAYIGGDVSNCGGCGVACSATDVCASGTCVPVGSLAIASSLSQPEDLVVDGTDIFFTTLGDNSIGHVGTDGGAVSVLATGQAQPKRIAVDSNYVYWSSYLGGGIARIARTGAGSVQLVASAVNPWGLTVDDTYVYWADGSTGDGGSSSYSLMRAPKAGGGPVVAFPIDPGFGRPEEVLRDGTTLYLGGDKFTMPGGPAQRFSDFTGAGAVGGGFLYSDGKRIDLATGSIVIESTSASGGNGPANSCGVFGKNAAGPTNGGNGLFFMHVTGWRQTNYYNREGLLTAPLIHQVQGAASTSPARVVADGSFVYWTDSYAGAIYKLPLPQ